MIVVQRLDDEFCEPMNGGSIAETYSGYVDVEGGDGCPLMEGGCLWEGLHLLVIGMVKVGWR